MLFRQQAFANVFMYGFGVSASVPVDRAWFADAKISRLPAALIAGASCVLAQGARRLCGPGAGTAHRPAAAGGPVSPLRASIPEPFASTWRPPLRASCGTWCWPCGGRLISRPALHCAALRSGWHSCPQSCARSSTGLRRRCWPSAALFRACVARLPRMTAMGPKRLHAVPRTHQC